jgi:hypothetical protein
MSRIKTILAVLLVTAIVGIVPQAQAQTVKLVIAGSSALWQTAALGTFGVPSSTVSGTGTCSPLLTGCTSPTYHWTSAKSGANEPYLNDTRPSPANQDVAPTWVVWDSSSPVNVWIFAKVDTIVGDRCYFARPACDVILPSGAPVTGANLISVWNNSLCSSSCDTSLPASIQALLVNGLAVNAAASDIRPEDAAFAIARANSALGASTYSNGGSDGLDGLGYNVNNPAGVAAPYHSGTSIYGLGNPVKSGIPGSTQTANVLAFNITGKDPFTGTTVPAYTVTVVGGEPVVFVASRSNSLAGLTNATELQLQQAFSGNICDASAFGLAQGGINIFLREPLSGTYNTVEATVFRRPTVYTGSPMAAGTGVLGISQETNVGSGSNVASNPLTSATPGACVAAGNPSGNGARYRGIGTGEVVLGVQYSNNTATCTYAAPCFTTAQDGIAYSFFSYGNIKSLAGSSSYGYITLNGVDPIFQSYNVALDPGQLGVTGGQLPLHTPCGATGPDFPCQESAIWSNGFSFPNVRNGTYRSWSLLRTLATGAASTNLAALVKASNAYVVSSVPDYIPVKAVTCNSTSVPACSPAIADLGLKLLRSHYEQRDGNGLELGKTTAIVNEPTENGGDMGGMIIPDAIGVTTEQQTQLVQNQTSTSLGPVARPK